MADQALRLLQARPGSQRKMESIKSSLTRYREEFEMDIRPYRNNRKPGPEGSPPIPEFNPEERRNIVFTFGLAEIDILLTLEVIFDSFFVTLIARFLTLVLVSIFVFSHSAIS